MFYLRRPQNPAVHSAGSRRAGARTGRGHTSHARGGSAAAAFRQAARRRAPVRGQHISNPAARRHPGDNSIALKLSTNEPSGVGRCRPARSRIGDPARPAPEGPISAPDRRDRSGRRPIQLRRLAARRSRGAGFSLVLLRPMAVMPWRSPRCPARIPLRARGWGCAGSCQSRAGHHRC
jgi:hypothetical protein